MLSVVETICGSSAPGRSRHASRRQRREFAMDMAMGLLTRGAAT